MSRLIGILLLTAPLLCGQIGWNTVTVSVSRNAAVAGDQTLFSVVVESGPDQNLSDIAGLLAGTGITAADFAGLSLSGVYIDNSGVSRQTLAWRFQLQEPSSQLKETTAALIAVRQKLVPQGGGLSLTFSVSGNQPAGQGPACSQGDLVADARAQAQKLASAAGLTAGAIVGLSSSVNNGLPAPCALTARFALGLMFGQTDPNAISITAIRTANQPPPDQAVIQLTVASPLDTGLDAVSAALSGAGISGATFSGMGGPVNVGTSSLEWTFAWMAPLSGLKQAAAMLAAAQQAIAQAKPGLSLSWLVQYAQYSTAAQQSQSCVQADLFADALAHARSLAAAASVSVGPILTVSDTGGAIAGSFAGPVAAYIYAGPFYAPPLSCSVTVQYQLAR